MSDSGFDPNRPTGIDREDPVPDQDILDAEVQRGPDINALIPGTGEIGQGEKIPGAGGSAGEQGSFGDTIPGDSNGDIDEMIEDDSLPEVVPAQR